MTVQHLVWLVVLAVLLFLVWRGTAGAARALRTFFGLRGSPTPDGREDAPQAPSPATWGANVRPASPELEQEIEENLRGGG